MRTTRNDAQGGLSYFLFPSKGERANKPYPVEKNVHDGRRMRFSFNGSTTVESMRYHASMHMKQSRHSVCHGHRGPDKEGEGGDRPRHGGVRGADSAHLCGHDACCERGHITGPLFRPVKQALAVCLLLPLLVRIAYARVLTSKKKKPPDPAERRKKKNAHLDIKMTWTAAVAAKRHIMVALLWGSVRHISHPFSWMVEKKRERERIEKKIHTCDGPIWVSLRQMPLRAVDRVGQTSHPRGRSGRRTRCPERPL